MGWSRSISQQYQCEDIIVDELPEEANLTDFLHAFREAQIKSIVITGNALRNIDLLLTYKCRIGEKCSTRRILENGSPATEVIKGIRVYL